MSPARRDEAAWLRFIRDLWGVAGLAPGHGDDAVLLPPAPYALTTDFLSEGCDFERGWGPWEAVGHKALAANLSDLAASGARPNRFLLDLALPCDLEDGEVERLLRGLHALSAREGVLLAGGDLSASRSGLCIAITAVGVQDRPPLLRSGGRPGDLLYVSGALGGPREALRRFKAGERLDSFPPEAPAPGTARALLDRFFRPPSQTALGLFLAERGLCSACLDLSDGLARDLPRLCEASSVGAEVALESLPLETPGLDPAQALLGGEEQVLLLAVSEEKAAALVGAPGTLTRIGRLTPGAELVLVRGGRRSDWPSGGFDHFAP